MACRDSYKTARLHFSTCPNTNGPFQGPGYIGPASTSNWPGNSGQVRVRVTLRLTVSQSVCLGIEPNLGQLTRVYFLLEISFRQLQVCNFVAPSLTRGGVCKLLYNCFWALPEQSLLGRSPAELMALFCCLI
jgi:hypothetical protein